MVEKSLKMIHPAEPSYDTFSDQSSSSSNHENSVPPDDEDISCCEKFKNALFRCGGHYKSLRVEVVAFLVMFSSNMTAVTSTTLILEKVCLLNFNYSHNVCTHLEDFQDIKTSVEKVATNYQLGHSLIQALPAAIFATLIGPWSDHYGRKFPILLALSGMILDALGSTFCAYYIYSKTEYYFIPPIFYGICGGNVAIMAVVYSYIPDTSPVERRTLRYAFLFMYLSMGIPLGILAGGWIYNFLSYPAVFFFSALGYGLCCLWVILRVPETRGLENKDPWKLKIKNLFSCNTFKESCKAISKERPHRGRTQVIVLIICVCFLIAAMQSTSDINYLYVLHQFHWSNTVFSTSAMIYSLFGVVMYVIVMPLLKKFKAGDPTLGLIGAVTLLVKNVGIGVSFKPGIYHLASIAGLLGGCGVLACQSRISKAVSSDDLAKIFSFVATAEALSPIFFSVAMTQTYSACLDFFPGMPYIIVAAMLIIPIISFIWLIRVPMPYA